MIRQGLRILRQQVDGKTVPLPDILEEIQNGNQYYWSILELEASGHLGDGISMPDFEDQIFNLEKRFFIDWPDLVQMSKKFDQIIWISIIGAEEQSKLCFYKNNQQKFESFDFIIDMFDGSYWEIFSTDEQFIQRLVNKFPRHKLLTSDAIR